MVNIWVNGTYACARICKIAGIPYVEKNRDSEEKLIILPSKKHYQVGETVILCAWVPTLPEIHFLFDSWPLGVVRNVEKKQQLQVVLLN